MKTRILIVLTLSIVVLVFGIEFEVTHYRAGGVKFNRIQSPAWSGQYNWAVGDSGQVFKLNQNGLAVDSFNLDTAYNLTGIAVGNYGYIVGYKRATNTAGPKWKGAVWRSTDGGYTWNYLNTPPFPGNITVPYLNVAVAGDVVYVSCGFGYVLKSQNGGSTWNRVSKPVPSGEEDHFGWLWGIWCDPDNSDSVWVCSDQSKLIAVTGDGGDNWDSFTPPFDSLSYNDVSLTTSYIEDAAFAASRGKLVLYYDGNLDWHYIFGTLGASSITKDQWFYGVYNFDNEKFCTGSGGTIGSWDVTNEARRKYWYSRRYDLSDIEAQTYVGENDTRTDWYAVGSNAAILHGLQIGEMNYPLEMTDTVCGGNPLWDFYVEDQSEDNGWVVNGSWDQVHNADYYKVYVKPKNDINLHGVPTWGDYELIKIVNEPTRSFTWDSALTGMKLKYKVEAWQNNAVSPFDDKEAYCTALDNVSPPKVTDLQGVYNRTLDAAVIWWDAITPAQEPNLGGYQVCPEIVGLDYHINHPSPLYRNYYAEKVPDWARGHNWGFWVRAMDRSKNCGDWSDSVLIPIPNLPTSSPYATALNQGRHIARWNKNAVLHVTYEDEDKVWELIT